MHKTIFSRLAGPAGLLLAAGVLTAMTGCVGYVDGPRASVYVAPDVVVEDEYVYYPGYDVYYNSSRRQYAYLEGGAWVARPAPRGISINVLQASPSVRMTFHDSPANHHVEMTRKYPHNWTPRGAHSSGKEDHRDDHVDKNGR